MVLDQTPDAPGKIDRLGGARQPRYLVHEGAQPREERRGEDLPQYCGRLSGLLGQHPLIQHLVAQGEQQIGRKHLCRMIGRLGSGHPALGQHPAQYLDDGRPGARVGTSELALDAHVLDAVLQHLLERSFAGRQLVHRKIGVAHMGCLVGQVAPGQIPASRIVLHIRDSDAPTVGAGVVTAHPDLDAELAAQRRRHDGQGVSQRV